MAHQRKLAQPQGDGRPLREHLKSVAGRSVFAAAELTGPAFPPELGYLWQWFMELHAARTFNAHGPNPITYAEIRSWAILTKARPTPWEVDLLRTLDLKWMAGPG